MLSCFGQGHDAIWEAVCNGQCGIDHITRFDVSEYDSQIAAQVPDFEMHEAVDPKLSKRADRFTKFALHCSQLAIENSGLQINEDTRNDIGVLIGSGIGGMETWEKQFDRLREKGPGRVSPFLVPMLISDMASGLVSIMTGARGPNLTAVTACASATHSTGTAFDFIRHGRAEVMITGGTEAAVTETALSGFCAARALSTRNDDPKKSCRPMDRDRDGFVIGEGCTIVILEEMERAKKRGADIYGELLGFGMSGDAYHITAPDPDGIGAVLAMQAALKDAKLKPKDIDYINAHAPGTPEGDKMEARALMELFGDDCPPISSTKGNHAHQLGATGATELILSLTMAHEGYIPPTANCDNPDDFITFDIVRGSGRDADIGVLMSNSFGFGGHNAVLIATTAGY